MRRSVLWVGGGSILLALAFSTPAPAGEKKAATCDPQHRSCCTQWEFSFAGGNGQKGALHYDTYKAALKERDQLRRWDRQVCRWSRGRDSACNVTYSGLHCWSGGVRSAAARLLVKSSLDTFKRTLDRELRRAGLLEDAYEALARGGGPLAALDNPFVAASLEVHEYVKSLGEVRERVEKLRDRIEQLQSAPERQVQMGLMKAWNIGSEGFLGGQAGQSAWFDQLADIGAALPKKRLKLKPPPKLAVARDYRVASIKLAKAGRKTFVLAGPSVLQSGSKLPHGSYPLGAMTVTAGKGARRAVSFWKSRDRVVIHVAGVGSVVLRAIPDRDHDGIVDKKDACPDQPGPAEANGCPDRDGDGVVDKKDVCPDQAGPAKADGCPDRDGDGVPDAVDQCVSTPGPAPMGCPTNSRKPKNHKKGTCSWRSASPGCPAGERCLPDGLCVKPSSPGMREDPASLGEDCTFSVARSLYSWCADDGKAIHGWCSDFQHPEGACLPICHADSDCPTGKTCKRPYGAAYYDGHPTLRECE